MYETYFSTFSTIKQILKEADMGIFKFLLLCAGAFACLSAWADTYRRGNGLCESLSEVEREYNREPDNIINQTTYGECLIAAYRDEEGLFHLRSAGEKGDIAAVFELARYYQTGGTLDDRVLEPNNIPQAIGLYLQVTQMIQNYQGYPFGSYVPLERQYSMEMNTYYIVTSLYYKRFLWGSFGAENFRKNGNQESEAEGGETSPQHREHTTDSLQKTIHYAEICLNVPLKYYFDESKYNQYRSLCQILKNHAQILLDQGLNTERLRLVNDPACYRDLDNCEPYQEVMGEMIAIIRTGHQQVAEVWNNG